MSIGKIVLWGLLFFALRFIIFVIEMSMGFNIPYGNIIFFYLPMAVVILNQLNKSGSKPTEQKSDVTEHSGAHEDNVEEEPFEDDDGEWVELREWPKDESNFDKR